MKRLIALVAVLLAGCGSAPAAPHEGPYDHAALAMSLEVGIDAPSSGSAGYRLDVTVRALSGDRSEAYAWDGNLTFHFVPADVRNPKGLVTCHAASSFDVTRAVRLAAFRNDLGAGDHWTLPLAIQDSRFGDGHYAVTVTAAFDHAATPRQVKAEFTHCPPPAA
ncbi:MAG: hypothetical protein V4510_11225 [bacterium]